MMRSLGGGLLTALPAALAAWLLTPTWAVWGLSPSVLTVGVFGYLLALVLPLARVPERFRGPSLAGLLTLAGGAIAAVVAAAVSLRYAQLAGLATGALAGCWLAGIFRRSASDGRRLVPFYVLTIAGIAVVASLEPEPPLPGLLVMAAAPLAVWAGAAGPISRLSGLSSVAVQAAAVLAILAAGAAWTLVG